MRLHHASDTSMRRYAALAYGGYVTLFTYKNETTYDGHGSTGMRTNRNNASMFLVVTVVTSSS